MCNCVIQALSQSASLQELSWCGAELTLKVFRNFVHKSSQTLKRLFIDLNMEFIEHSDIVSDERRISRAIGRHEALQHLTLGNTNDEKGLAGRILYRLHRAKRLQSLRLVSESPPVADGYFRPRSTFYGDFFGWIKRFLKNANNDDGNEPFQRLEMDRYTLVDNDMRRLLQGLVRYDSNGNASDDESDDDESDDDDDDDDDDAVNYRYSRDEDYNSDGDDDDDSQPISSIAISSLRLTNCSWPVRSARNRLTAFLQRRTMNDNDSNLREVHIGCSDSSLRSPFSQQLAASLLKQGKMAQPYPTVGSQLVTLGLDRVEPDFFTHLSNHARLAMSSSLQELHLCGISKEASVAFADGLPKLTMIRKLSLEQVAKDATKDVLQGLKSNSSVVNVTTSATSGFDVAQERKIQAYCRRNQELHSLIESEAVAPDSTAGNNGSSGISTSTATGTHDRTASMETRTNTAATAESSGRLLLYPALLQAAQQVPSTQEEMLLRGLLSLGQSCGSLSSPLRCPPPEIRDAKRSRPS